MKAEMSHVLTFYVITLGSLLIVIVWDKIDEMREKTKIKDQSMGRTQK